jgi:hypothetical protein
VRFARSTGDDHDARLRMVLESRAYDLATIDVRHVKVGHDGVKGLSRQRVKSIGSAGVGRDVVSIAAQKGRHPLYRGRIIVHDEEASH